MTMAAVEVRYSGQDVEVQSAAESVEVQTRQFALDVASVVMVGGIPYTGEYEVTPSDEAQVLETSGLMMTDNVTINPIPSNYGLITWNGSTLTVS